MMVCRSRLVRWSIAVFLTALLLFSLSPAVGAANGAKASPEGARAEAARLMSRVSDVRRSSSRSAAAEPSWGGASTGDPLLLYSFGGTPSSYLVPVIAGTGEVEGIIGVSASTGKWCWYSEEPQKKFPLVSAVEATATVGKYLHRRGIDVDLPEPQARLAPDKNTYWFFELGNGYAIDEVYLPVFIKGIPETNLETPPWSSSAGSGIETPGSGGTTGGGASTATAAQAGGTTVATTATAGGSRHATSTHAGGAPSAYDIPDVPYHSQETGYWCGPAALEMLLDYWGPDISQTEIAQVANATSSVGAYNDDILRAAQFSSLSAAKQNPALRGYTSRSLGYGAAQAYWKNGSSLYSRRYSDLKELVSEDYPVLVLTRYDNTGDSGHFRLVKGYNDSVGDFIVHDPWYSAPYEGPDVHFNQSYFVDQLWTYSDRWGMIASPWAVDVYKPTSVSMGQTFSVTATVSYGGPSPLNGQFNAASPTATFRSSGDYQILGGSATQTVAGMGTTGSSGTVTWKAKALSSRSTDDISVLAEGRVIGTSSSYYSYSDWVGGVGSSPGTPPVTTRTWGTDSIGTNSTSRTWYLAEGSTNGGFETWVLVQNPGGTSAHVNLTYMTPHGAVSGPSVSIPANSRASFSIGDTLPGEWSVSTRVDADHPVVAERSMYWGGRREGHNSIGVTAASQTWYLAEGSTAGGMQSWILVQNPNSAAARVKLTYMTPSGKVGGPTVTLPANSRQTFFVADTVPNQWSVSTMVTSDNPVIAERAVYGSTASGTRTWGTDSIGVKGSAKNWYLAEGCTAGGFETWVLVGNPSDSSATVSLTYMTPDGAKAGPTTTLAPNSRKTFNVADSVPNAWEVSTRVTSATPVIAERSMYGGNRTWGHASVGTSTPAKTWYLAEGCTQNGFETWILVQNPNDSPAEISLTYMTPSGPVVGPIETLPAHSRKSYNVAYTVPVTWEVSTKVDSNVPVIAERSMYGDPK